ncbi:MAG: polysaccharide biosynthesis tyrosine autokinase [Pyrinomonadaceae bacterium]
MKETREIIQKPIVEPSDLERSYEQQVIAAPGRYPQYRDLDAAEGFQLVDYWRAIRKRLWLVIGIAVLATTLAAIYMARKPDIFLAKAVIQVDNEQANPDLMTEDRQRPMSSSDPAYFNTQLRLLGSDSLYRRAIKEHNLDANKDFQQSISEGSVSAVRSFLKAIGLASDAPKKSRDGEGDLGSDLSLASSEEIDEAVRLAPLVTVIHNSIVVEPIRESRASTKDTRLIELSFIHRNPELAAFVVNGVAESFIGLNQEKRSGTSRKTNDFLQERIADLQSEIKSDEVKLVDLKKREGILKTDGEQTIVIDRLSGLNKQLLEAENLRKNAQANYFAVKDEPERVKAISEVEMSRFITERENEVRALRNETQKKIAELGANRAKLSEEFKPGAPEIQEIDAQVKSLETSISKVVDKNNDELKKYRNQSAGVVLENLKIKYQQAKDHEDQVRAAFSVQYDQAQGQNQGAVLLKLLEQNIETNQGFLENLIKQQSSNDVAAQGTENNISVVEIAVPSEVPVSPRRVMTVAAALILSTLFGMGLALFLEYLDDTIRTTEEIENYIQLPALAAIPTIDASPKRRLLLVGSSDDDDQPPPHSSLLISDDPRSSLAEAFRQLRTSILLSTAGHAPKSLLITSSLPGEGKTTTATNTAISLAQTGAKVLIIDADMRRPRLHSVFDMNNGEGLSTLLSSEFDEREIESVIKYDEASKLHILSAGPVPPNPAELIGSEQMAKLLKLFQSKYTHVVVDSPPIASFTDGVLIASLVDGVILVVHAGKSSRQIVRRSRQQLQEIGAKIFGVVLNNANLKSQDNYYYQSYYHRDSYRNDDLG